jgi:hypothetical protein
MSIESTVPATYDLPGDPEGRYAGYFPAWLDNMADDVTLEGSLLEGAVQGPEAVRAVVLAIRNSYESQEFRFAGPVGEHDWMEDYIGRAAGEAVGCVLLVTRDADGRARNIVAGYRPLGALLNLSRRVGATLAGTPYREFFAGSDASP